MLSISASPRPRFFFEDVASFHTILPRSVGFIRLTLRPRTPCERPDRGVDVLGPPSATAAIGAPSGIEHRKVLPLLAATQFAVDQKLVRFGNESRRGSAEAPTLTDTSILFLRGWAVRST